MTRSSPVTRRDIPGVLALALALAGIIAASMATARPCRAQTADSSFSSIGRRRIQPLPALGSAPETGLQYGATVLAVWQPATERRTRPSSILVFALRTRESQTRLGIETERWTEGNARRFAATLHWQEYPLPYYGIGDRTPESDKELFTPKGLSGSLTVQQRLRGAWYATTSLMHSDQRLATDTTGSLRTALVVGANGGRVSEWTVGVLRDTREHLYAPRGGHFIQLGYARSAKGVWSDFSYGRLRLDARAYRAIAGHHVLATQLVLVAVDGAAPFDRLALVGGSDILRGYALGRYRDRALAATQAEYRSPLFRRVGAVLFAGAGLSTPSFGALGARAVLPTVGVGLRTQLDQRQRTSIRADLGRGRDGASGLYIGFNQAF